MMLCQHEEIAVQIAHGYAKATGKPMAVILHNLVGLLHACMAIYYAYIDRVPIFIIGATGPMDEGQAPAAHRLDPLGAGAGQRHPRLRQVGLPADLDRRRAGKLRARLFDHDHASRRARSTCATTPPCRRRRSTREVPLPPAGAAATPAPMAPDPRGDRGDRRQAARGRASRCCCAEYAGRRAGGFESIVELAETTGAAVWDVNNALNFPNKHPLCLSMDKERAARTPIWSSASTSTTGRSSSPSSTTPSARASSSRRRRAISSRSASARSTSANGRWTTAACSRARCGRWATPRSAFPSSPASARSASPATPQLQRRIAERKSAIGKRHDQVWAKWQEEARKNWDASPITFARLALEVWDVIKDEDWVLTANNLKQQVRKLWDFDRPYRHPGVELGTSTQIGISLGVALAHKGKGRIVVDIQPDGDLMFDAGALWVAAKYEIPMLVVMHNNRAYYNDWEHQIRMAKLRGTDEAKAHIGMDLFGPEPDFAALARSMGCYGEGPIDKPQDIRPALLRALAEVKKGRLALVDTITQHR